MQSGPGNLIYAKRGERAAEQAAGFSEGGVNREICVFRGDRAGGFDFDET